MPRQLSWIERQRPKLCVVGSSPIRGIFVEKIFYGNCGLSRFGFSAGKSSLVLLSEHPDTYGSCFSPTSQASPIRGIFLVKYFIVFCTLKFRFLIKILTVFFFNYCDVHGQHLIILYLLYQLHLLLWFDRHYRNLIF